ncbi:MAG: type II toxin-antitoxin system RelE/ParE family toxin [Dehalococcoidia bacterium]
MASAQGRDDVRTYLDGMQQRERAKMVALLHRAADNGPPFNNPERCRPLKGEDFNEFKTYGHRIFWARADGRIALLTAFSKKQDRTTEAELGRGRNALAALRAELGGQ